MEPHAHIFTYRMKGMNLMIHRFLPALKCGVMYQVSVLCMYVNLNNERSPREAPLSLVLVPFPKRFLSLNGPFACSHIFKTGPIDGYEKDCPVQLRGHLSPLRKRYQAHSVSEHCFQCLWWQQCLESSTPAHQLPGHFYSPPQSSTLISHLHLKCSCWGPPWGSQMDRRAPCLASLP